MGGIGYAESVNFPSWLASYVQGKTMYFPAAISTFNTTTMYIRIQHNTTQHNTTQHNTTQHNTTQHNTTQHNTIQYNTIQYNTIQYNTIQYNTIQYNTIQYNTIQYNTIQYMEAKVVSGWGEAYLQNHLKMLSWKLSSQEPAMKLV